MKQKENQELIKNAKNNLNKNESGKSMVEMLGVLALMGLLSILGAKGYNMAMERAIANTIINDISKRSVVHSQQLLAGSSLNTSEMSDKIQEIYPVSAEKLGTQFFTLKVTQVETPVCKRIAELGYAVPIQITANGTKIDPENTTPCENQMGIVEMAFTFNRTLTPCPGCLDDLTTCSTNSQCANNEVCQDGLCMCAPQYSCAGVCCSNGQSCINGKCSSTAQACDNDSECDGVCENGACICYSYRDCRYYCDFGYGKNGVCSATPNMAQGSNVGENGVVWGSVTMNWYTAHDFCESDMAGKKRLVTFSELGCIQKENLQDWDCSNIKDKYKNKGSTWVDEIWADTTRPWFVNTNKGSVGTAFWTNVSLSGGAICY